MQQEQLPLQTDTSQQALGKRYIDQFDRIIALYVAATVDNKLRGPDIVVAAEKAGLVFGYMNVYHRLVDGRPDAGPVFSAANIVSLAASTWLISSTWKPPAIAFFLTLPAHFRVGCVGNHGAGRTAHGQLAGWSGAGRRTQRIGASAHSTYSRRIARL